jgi:hypothetical protein
MTDPFEPWLYPSHITARDGEAFIWEPRPGIVLQKAVGLLSLPLMQGFIEFFAPILKPGAGVQVFADFARITRYTTEARDLVTRFSIERRNALHGIHILMGSKDLALGVNSFRYAVGEDLVFAYSDRGSFLGSLERAMNPQERPHRVELPLGRGR